MTEPLDITVIIATRNEEANIAACLDSIIPVQRVLVIDSGSVDRTVALARARNAEVVDFTWSGIYPRKRQWAIDHLHIKTRWIMLVDADESIRPDMWMEIKRVIASADPCTAYLARKDFHFLGKRLRFGGFSHEAVLLFQTGMARFENLLPDSGENLDMEVHERLIVDGRVGRFQHALIHRDAKGLAAYVDRHHAYALWEAELRYQALHHGQYGADAIRARWNGNVQERRRFLKRIAMRIPGEAMAWFIYHYLIRGGFLEGRAGFLASRVRYQYIREVRALLQEKRKNARVRG